MIKLIEISGDSCASCHALLPALNRAAEEFNLAFERIDAESSPDVIEKYSVARIPAIILEDDGEVIGVCSGYQPEEILMLWIQSRLEERASKK